MPPYGGRPNMFLGRIGSGVFEQKLLAAIDRTRMDQALLPPTTDGICRASADSGHLR